MPLVSNEGLAPDEVSERQIIDHPWLQRLRQIHQLQTAWWVFPSAEHTRFQHVLGVMHLASRAAAALYDSLQLVCPDVPSRSYVECLLRLAGLLHDVGHGPFGHFFDEHYLSVYGLTHETLGSVIIEHQLGDLIRRVRRNPNGALLPDESLDPAQISLLITRPKSFGSPNSGQSTNPPQWLIFLRSLFSGIYTVDNMDFVLRDAYMSGYNTRAYDLERLLRYSFFSEAGLTIHARGLDALLRFIGVRAELFRSIYFHRTVRAIDLELKDLFTASRPWLFPGNPLDKLDEYLHFTEWTLLVDAARWKNSADLAQREVGQRWQDLLNRRVRWKMVCQRTLVYRPGDAEGSSIFSNAQFIEQAVRSALPANARETPLRFDLARHVHRPETRGPAAGQNFLFDPALGHPRPLDDDLLYRNLPVAYRICRIYAENQHFASEITASLDRLIGPGVSDDLTNM
ncbi:MAG TPA: HD domain-containing protein [Pirellulales bacterium]|nr:HD domain-containing protein [Pirellulales bacterium]